MADAIPVNSDESLPAEPPPVELPPVVKPTRKRTRLDEPEEVVEASYRSPGGAGVPTHAAIREDF